MRKRIWWIALVCFVMISIIGVQMSWAEAPQTFRGQKSKATKVAFRDMEIEVPAGVDEDELTVQNSDVDLATIRKPRNFVMIGKPYRFGPDGKKFRKDRGLIGKISVTERLAKLYYINYEKRQLEEVPDQKYNTKQKKLVVKFRHFSDYVLGVTSGWDGNGLTPFSNFIDNGDEKVETKNCRLFISSLIASIPGRGFDLNLRRTYQMGGDSISRYPLAISGGWRLALTPFLFLGKVYMPTGDAYSLETNLINYIDIPNESHVFGLYNADGFVHAVVDYDEEETGPTIVYLSDGTRIEAGVGTQKVTDSNGNWVLYRLTEFVHEDINYENDASWSRVTSIEDSIGRKFELTYSQKNWDDPELQKIEQYLSNGTKKLLLTRTKTNNIESFTDSLNRTTKYSTSGMVRSTYTITITYPNDVTSLYTVYCSGDGDQVTTQQYNRGNESVPFRKISYQTTDGTTTIDDGITKTYQEYMVTYYAPYQKLLLTSEKVYNSSGTLLKQTDYTYPYKKKRDYVSLPKPTTISTCFTKVDGTLGSSAMYQYEYDNCDNVTRIVDPNGTETRMAYYNTNSRKDLSAFTVNGVSYQNVLYPNLYNNGLSAAWAGTNKLLTKATIIKDPVHNTTKLSQTHYEYDRRGNLWTEAVYDEKSNGYFFAKYTYDQYGNVLTKTDPKGNKLAFEYQSTNGYNSAYLTRVYNPNSSGNQTIATFEYDLALGKKKTATDPKGNIYRYEYDAIGRLTKEYLDNNSPTVGISRVIRYYDNDSHIELDFGGGVENRWEYGRIDYDPIIGKPKSIQRKNGNNWVTAKTIDYDSSGRLITETDGENHTTTHAYDALNREIKTTRPDTTYTTFAWDDRKVTVTDAKGNTKTQSYDLLDRLIQVDEHPQAGVTYTTKYLYDTFYDQESKASHLVQVINAKSANNTYTYDNLGRLLQVDYPQDGLNPMKPESYSYDQVGNLITKTVNGKTKTLAYDFYAGYRVTKVTEPDNRTVTYQYDNNDNITDQIVSNGVNYHFDYDARNRVTSSTAKIDGRNFVFGYGYDLFGRVVSINYPNRTNPVTYQYDDLDRLQSIGDFVNSCSYDLDNKLTNMALANGLKNSFTYNNVDRPTNIGAANTGTLVNLNYTYDAVGNITKLNGDCYDYDGMNRLVWAGNVANQSAATGSVARGTAWAYDGAGNLTAKQTYANGQLQQSITLGYDLANRLWSAGSTTYANDEFGNRTAKVQGSDSFGYQYDGENRLSQVTKNGATILQNTYDGSGMRVKKVNNGKTTYFVYQGENPLIEYSSDDNQLTYYIYAGKKSVAEEKDGQKTFYHRDHLGSTRALTDQNGKLKGLCKYDAWGKLESTNEYDEGVVNGDFQLNANGTVQTWVPMYDSGIANCSYTVNGGMSGSAAVKITRGTTGTSYWAAKNIFVSPDTDYVLTGYFLSGTTNSTKAKAQLVYYDSNGSVIAIHDSGNLGYSGSAWKEFALSSHAPVGAKTLEIRLTQDADQGMVVSFDGVRLKVPGLAGTYDYTGKKEDDGTGLYYYNARFYDPEVGRFITQDPIKDGLNWFSYCNNNPIAYIDPTGLSDESSDSNNDSDDFSSLAADISSAASSKEDSQQSGWQISGVDSKGNSVTVAEGKNGKDLENFLNMSANKQQQLLEGKLGKQDKYSLTFKSSKEITIAKAGGLKAGGIEITFKTEFNFTMSFKSSPGKISVSTKFGKGAVHIRSGGNIFLPETIRNKNTYVDHQFFNFYAKEQYRENHGTTYFTDGTQSP